MTIEFEDNGQDFLTWKLDNEGVVIDCQPFQASIWVGCRVIFAEELNPGDYVSFIDRWGEERTMIHQVDNIILEGE